MIGDSMKYRIGNQDYDEKSILEVAKQDEALGILSGARVIADGLKKTAKKPAEKKTEKK